MPRLRQLRPQRHYRVPDPQPDDLVVGLIPIEHFVGTRCGGHLGIVAAFPDKQAGGARCIVIRDYGALRPAP
jgi:hypothetical protein